MTLYKYFEINSAGTAVSYNHCGSKGKRREIKDQRCLDEICNSVNIITRGDINFSKNGFLLFFKIILSPKRTHTS